MKITLNFYQPNFKAIQLSKVETKLVSSTLNALKDEDLPDFKKSLLKYDVMDIFYPHIQKEASQSDDPKAKSTDLNIKMLDALNNFYDKKDPLKWFLSVLNGTEYEEKPTIFDLLEQKEEEERIKELELKAKNKQTPVTKQFGPEYNNYFKYDKERFYSKQEITNRAKTLQKYFGQQYNPKTILTIVEQNPYLVEYDNDEFDSYINEFADITSVDRETIIAGIAEHPEIMHFSFGEINDKAEEYSKISGCKVNYCKNVLIRKPVILTRTPELLKNNFDSFNFYKTVRGKNPAKPEAIFSIITANYYYLKTLSFLISDADKDVLKNPITNDKELIKHIKEQGIKPYKFIIPENEMTPYFMDFAEDFAMDNFGEDIFEFEVVSPNEYNRTKKPVSFAKYIHKNK